MEKSAGMSQNVLGLNVNPVSCQEAAGRALSWARSGAGGYVCLANVHMVMEAHDSPEYRRAVSGASLVVPDGRPIAWALGMSGIKGVAQVAGFDLTLAVLAAAAGEGVPVGFYGSAPEVLDALVDAVSRRFPGLRVAYAYSPPFRPLSPEEDGRAAAAINSSGARILFVSLGCPRQERWMAEHQGRVGAVMLGVGAAFDFIAGSKRRAPRWMRTAGLEWLFRLINEPRRLWRRYLVHNPRFAALLALQLLGAGPE